MKQTSNITSYINSVITNNITTFWKDDIFNYFVEMYLKSSYHDGEKYLHNQRKVYKCHFWFGKIDAIDDGHSLIASFSPKKFKAYCRRLNKTVKKV